MHGCVLFDSLAETAAALAFAEGSFCQFILNQILLSFEDSSCLWIQTDLFFHLRHSLTGGHGLARVGCEINFGNKEGNNESVSQITRMFSRID